MRKASNVKVLFDIFNPTLSMIKIREEKETRSGIYTRFKPLRGRPFFFLALLALFLISVFVFNKPGQRFSDDAATGITSPGSGPVFTREGELSFLKPDGSLIVTIDIEIADDDLQRQQGLMYRRQMDMLTGMLFIFEDQDYRYFWMKNTLLPLDIIYLNADRTIVRIHENTPPKSEQSFPSEYPSKYVVEVVAGFTALYNIRPGDRITFER